MKRFDEAFLYAHQLHQRQVRKGTGTPFITHLMTVAALVLEDGGDEDQAIAALLHDAVEDQGGWETLEAIRARFGDPVASIVEACTDAFEEPKPPWRERKERFLQRLEQAPPAVLRVSLADKLHNARSLARDLQHAGPSTWQRFRGGREGSLWYYRSLVEIFQRRISSPMVGELVQAVSEIERYAGTPAGTGRSR